MDVPRDDVARTVVDHPAGHLRVLGPPGSGKTRLVIERYRALARAGSGAFILTYSREQLKRITRDLIATGTSNAGISPVLTHFTLAREIVAASGWKAPRIVEGIEEALLVRQILDRYASDFKSDYKTINESEIFQRDLIALFHLLVQNGIKEDALAALKSSARGARLVDALALYERYLAGLSATGCVTFYDMSWVAAGACAALPSAHPFRRARVWLVDDFQDIDAGQFALLNALVEPNGDAALNIFGDPMGPFFGFRGTHERYLMSEFPERYRSRTIALAGACLAAGPLGQAVEALTRETLGTDAKEYLPLQALSARGPSVDRSPGRAKSLGPLFDPPPEASAAGTAADVRLEVAEDEVDEVYTAAERVRDLIARGRCRPRDIAVVANDKRRYEPLLRAAFEQRGVPLDTGRPPASEFRGFVRSLFLLIEAAREPAAMEAFATSPFYRHFRDRCLKASGRGVSPEGDRDTLRRYLQSVAVELDSIPPGERMRYVVHRLLLPACESYGDETGDELVYAFLSVLAERWQNYCAALEATRGNATLGEFMRVSRLFETRSDTAMPSAEEVGFYSCREMKGRYFRAVVLLGCSELLFPSVMMRDGLMPTAALAGALAKALPDRPVEVYGARPPDAHLRGEYHLLHLALTRAREVLYVSAPKMFAGQAKPAPATVLANAWPREAYHDTPANERTPPQIRFAWAWTGAGAPAGLAERLAPLNAVGPLWNLSPPPAEPFAVKRFTLSQSSFGSFFKCRRRFFYQRVLRLPDDDSIPAKLGGIFHNVMANIGRAFPTKEKLHGGISDDAIYGMIDEEIHEDGTVPPSSLIGRALRFHLYVYVKTALRLDRSESHDYTVRDIEENFEFTCDGWEFRGRRDRVEHSVAEGVTLIDYKTGKFNKTADNLRGKVLAAADNPEDANWQVPFYVWGYRQQSKEWPAAFKHVVIPPAADPFTVTLYIREREEDVPPEARKKRKPAYYLLQDEVEAAVRQAAAHAEEIFSERAEFERVDVAKNVCGYCPFRRVCGRSDTWN
ncbi:MAG: PD-(D/E)XK nuclease family protein [Candidatus Krumholzibacteriia bacterium]